MEIKEVSHECWINMVREFGIKEATTIIRSGKAPLYENRIKALKKYYKLNKKLLLL